jgi:peptidase S41-like protein
MSLVVRRALVACAFLSFSPIAFSESTITEQGKAQVIGGTLARIREIYVEPGDIDKIETTIRGNAAKGEYRAATTPEAFAHQLEEDLRKVSADPHFWLSYVPGEIPPLPTSMKPRPETDEQRQARLHAVAVLSNNGFARVERLDGNVGVIVLTSVYHTDEILETAAAAMSFLKDTSALILDVRQVRGGDPTGVVHVLSYFVERRIHAYDFVGRKPENAMQYFTDATLRGPRYAPQKPVYVLTSTRTFSGGEAMTDAMRTWRHAKVVGERTKGGANSALPTKATDHFTVVVPFMKTVNRVTGKNWNRVGIEPDVAVPAEKAQDAAYLLALESIAATTPSAAFREQVQALIQKLKSKS